MKRLKQAGLLVGLFLFGHQAWSVHPCAPLMEAAGSDYQVAENHFAAPINQTLPAQADFHPVSRLGVWQIYRTFLDPFHQACQPHVLNDQPGLVVYPVAKNSVTQSYAVMTGQFLIQASTSEQLERWQQDFNLSRQLTLPNPASGIFQAPEGKDYAEILQNIQNQIGLIQIAPLFTEQRYRTR
ncbi:MAG: hypothetical protein IBX55_22140 [Methyloprofundus sp.]|nr:hypothetical protein [Methyloprofundus sp.]